MLFTNRLITHQLTVAGDVDKVNNLQLWLYICVILRDISHSHQQSAPVSYLFEHNKFMNVLNLLWYTGMV